VLRDDPPVQNTRRFVARDGVVAGQPMKADDTVLLVLAAASRDPTAPPGCFAFGRGAHACPGEGLSTTIARAGIERLLLAGEGTLVQALPPITYRPSANTRIPRFGKESEVR